MQDAIEQIYRFKVTLQDIKPSIWRRLDVPSTYSFWDLHVAIQDAMGWLDCHLHEFRVPDPGSGRLIRLGIPDDEIPEADQEVQPGWGVAVEEYVVADHRTFQYEYDFGDSWEHVIVLEQILPREERVAYPVCLAGERACPPEDVGGAPGYEEFLRVIADPDDEDYERMIMWAGGRFDSERFEPGAVRFDDPKERWKIAFGHR